jgi:dihydrofolate reductase
MIKAILACDEEWGIGKNNALPWPKNPADLKWFKSCTVGGTVVMGRNTWESDMPTPLSDRTNIVVSSDTSLENDGCMVVSLSALRKLFSDFRTDEKEMWIIGGATLIDGVLPCLDEIWLSRIPGTFDCDVFLPSEKISNNFMLMSTETDNGVTIEKWIK